jgi:hypothetical protein
MRALRVIVPNIRLAFAFTALVAVFFGLSVIGQAAAGFAIGFYNSV